MLTLLPSCKELKSFAMAQTFFSPLSVLVWFVLCVCQQLEAEFQCLFGVFIGIIEDDIGSAFFSTSN